MQCSYESQVPLRYCWIQFHSSFSWLRTGCRLCVCCFFFFLNLRYSQFTQEMSICWLLLLFLCSELQSPWKTRPARACVYKPGFKSGLDFLFQLSKWLTCSLQHSFLLRQPVGCAKVPWSVCCAFGRAPAADSAAPWRWGWAEDSSSRDSELLCISVLLTVHCKQKSSVLSKMQIRSHFTNTPVLSRLSERKH